MQMPTLESSRLVIRPFRVEDLATIHLILDLEIGEVAAGAEAAQALDDRRRWLDWSVHNEVELARLYQPPLGDRAVVLRADDTLIGACGYVPCLMPFGQLPAFAALSTAGESRHASMELGLYWAISPRFQGQGYATEAGRALIDYAFAALNVGRIVATTDHANAASIAVMRKLGMQIERNPYAEPPWLQIVGLLARPDQ